MEDPMYIAACPEDTDVVGDIEKWARSELDTGHAEWGWYILREEALQRLASDDWLRYAANSVGRA